KKISSKKQLTNKNKHDKFVINKEDALSQLECQIALEEWQLELEKKKKKLYEKKLKNYEKAYKLGIAEEFKYES
ncbi:904_t:CDS:1, partial [Dentiscutata heterogama]